MKKSRTSMLCRITLVIVVFAMLLTLVACEGSNANESKNRYNIEVEEQTSDFYVNDFANIFSEDQKQVMMTDAVNLAEEYDGVQVVVTTIESLKGHTIEEYAYSMYNQYGIGKDSMGILILLSTQDRQVKIETGQNMQAYITDSKSGQLLDDYGMDYFRNDEFAEGLVSVQEATIAEIKEVVPIDWNAEAEITGESESVVMPDDNVTADESLTAVDESTQVSDQINLEQTANESEIGAGNVIVLTLSMGALIFAVIVLAFACRGNNKKYKKYKANFDEKKKECSKFQQNNMEADRKNKELGAQVEALKEKFEKCQNQLESVQDENDFLKKKIADMQVFSERVHRVHPQIEKEIEDMLETEFRAAVESLNDQINTAIQMPADKENVEMFAEIIQIYENAKTDVKEAVTADIDKVRRLHQDSIKLRQRDQAVKDAKKMDERIKEVLHHDASKDNVGLFKKIIEEYNSSSMLTRNFVRADINNVKELYQKSIELLEDYEEEQQKLRNQEAARRAEDDVQRVVRRIGYSARESDRDDIERAFRYYKNLNATQRAYFSANLLSQMRRLQSEAEDDHKRKERRRREEEDERRRSTYNHSSGGGGSSIGGGSSFGGFGGHSSGGGASRGF